MRSRHIEVSRLWQGPHVPRTQTSNHTVRLGFDGIGHAFERASRPPSDGYPLYDVERIAATGEVLGILRVTLAVAGFARDQVDVLVEGGQLVIRGRQVEEKRRIYLHRGIAARQFQRVFLLADGMRVMGVDLADGLLRVDLHEAGTRRSGQVSDVRG